MTREKRAAIRKGIETSDLKGYKWTITPTGLEWSYGEQFDFTEQDIPDEEDKLLIVKARASGMTTALLQVGTGKWADEPNMEEAYRVATRQTIHDANYYY